MQILFLPSHQKGSEVRHPLHGVPSLLTLAAGDLLNLSIWDLRRAVPVLPVILK